jgi:hypothetical protein
LIVFWIMIRYDGGESWQKCAARSCAPLAYDLR